MSISVEGGGSLTIAVLLFRVFLLNFSFDIVDTHAQVLL